MNNNQSFKLDWLAFTYKPEEDLSGDEMILKFYDTFPEIFTFVALSGHEKSRFRPGNHYQVSIDCCDYFFISYDSTAYNASSKGVNVQVPSHGLFKFFEIMGIQVLDSKRSLYEMVHLLYERHCTLSRIDLCLDDFDKTFRPHDYERWIDQKMVSHNFHCWSMHTDAAGAETIYLGKERSDKFLRIYDKFLQSNGEIDSVRYEFELHGRPCKELGKFLLENDFDFGKYLVSWLKVLDPESIYEGTNLSKSKKLPEWETWLNLKFNEVPTPVKIPKEPKKWQDSALIMWADACRYALFTAMTLSGVDSQSAAFFLSLDDIELKEKLPLKYRRMLNDNNIEWIY